MVVQITTDFLPVPHVPSAFCPGVSCLHLLCSRYGGQAESNTGWVFPLPDEARVYGYHEEIKHFVECVARGETPRETFEDGVIVNVIIDAAYRSMKEHRWIPIDL